MTQIAYSFDKTSGEYVKPVQMQPSPREPGKYLQPANTLLEQPPAVGEHEVACAVDGAWVIKQDYRGTYYKPDRSAIEIEEIGVIPEADWSVDVPPYTLQETKSILAATVDNTVAGIYNQWTRFEAEYVLRESQAQAYKDAAYTGEVPRQVAAFADRAGVPYQQATDLILSQAAGLRTALANLGDLRMRKYEILNAADAATAQAKFDEIKAAIEAEAATIQ